MPNRLAQESSPYLRQHANNPVDWYPWAEEALSKAKAENKPILLSVGYSACHWCHVMEHESFENAAIAQLMNENFINIKVDREERPDLDQIYQNVAQLMTRSGGWPLTVFLTPDLRPFFGGTYFPPEDRYGRPGFPKVLQALANAFRNDHENVAENARRLHEAIGQLETISTESNRRPDKESLRKICDAIVSGVDWGHGGFGGAPKFPNTMSLTFLWRFGCATGFGMAQEAVVLSLTKMAQGGIYDQLGGGFHRYSVDERWAVPHFEKMLYDNASLLSLYSEVLLSANDLPAYERSLFTKTVEETVSYLLREMQSDDGGFYSTQDADSEGGEGSFFVWDKTSIEAAVNPEEAKALLLHFGVTAEGNFEHTGKTVLYVAMRPDALARELGVPEEQVKQLLSSGKAKMFAARELRPRPARDEKILSGWNGLLVSGLAWASRALAKAGRDLSATRALEAATRSMQLVRSKLSREDHRLWVTYKDGEAKINAYLDDYAFCARAALDLARTNPDPELAQELTRQADDWLNVIAKHFSDKAGGGFYFTSNDHEHLIHRPKSVYDQAIPSGNAVAAQSLLALAAISGSAEREALGDEVIYRLFGVVEKAPQGMGEMACASLLALMGPVTVAGEQAHEACVHPHVFRKPDSADIKGLVTCHGKVCAPPSANATSAIESFRGKLLLS